MPNAGTLLDRCKQVSEVISAFILTQPLKPKDSIMRVRIGLSIIVAIAPLLSGSLARAAGPGFCYKYSQSLINETLRTKYVGGGCGQKMSDRFWSTDKKIQMQWCLATSEDTVKRRVLEMQLVNEKCDYCKIYADTVSAAAVYNIKNQCGFTYDGDERWKPDREFHFIGCMRFETGRSGELRWTKAGLDSIAGDVTTQITQCKAENGVGTSSSALTVPKAIPPLRDSVGRVKHPGNASTKSNNDLAAPARPSNRRTTARETAVTEKSDHTPPTGRARSRPPNPCKTATATKPCSVGANTSAMDRLGGGSQLSTSSNPKTGEGNRRVPAGGGPSAAASPVNNMPAQKPDLTSDFGKCASCGKLSPATR